MELEELLSLTVEDLKFKLTELKLSTEGNKAALQAVLINYFRDETAVIDETFDDAKSTASRANKECGSHFTFRDVEDSMTEFTGDKYSNICEWIENFEETCDTVGWNAIQRFITRNG